MAQCTDPTCYPRLPHERADHLDPMAMLGLQKLAKARDVATAQELRAQGLSLFAIASELGRTKEWLREYAGLR